MEKKLELKEQKIQAAINNLADKKIDLVVPCYKCNKTLERLLASVLMQTIKNDIHIILVQDFDGENYSEIISNFNNMLDIELIQLEENKGVGAARRIGRKKGKNKYVMYMDSDDTFQNPFATEELYKYIEENNLDAVNSIFLEQIDGLNFITHDNNDWIWMFGKIYRRSFLEEKEIEMNNSTANEDTGFNSIVSMVGKIGFLKDITYIWHYKEDSITRKDGGIYRFTGVEGWLYNMEYAINNMLRLQVEEEKVKEFVASNIIATYIWFLEFYNDKDERIDIKKYIEWVKKYYKNVYLNHLPTENQICEAYFRKSNSKVLTTSIPKFTFKEYLEIINKECELQQISKETGGDLSAKDNTNEQ